MALQSAIEKKDDEAFIDDLQQGFSEAAQEVRGGLAAKSDDELLLVWAAHDARIATRPYYSEKIGALLSAYKTEVEPIGKTGTVVDHDLASDSERVLGTMGLMAVDLGDELPILVRVRAEGNSNGTATRRLRFIGFVSNEMRAAALARALRTQGRGVEQVARDSIEGRPAKASDEMARWY